MAQHASLSLGLCSRTSAVQANTAKLASAPSISDADASGLPPRNRYEQIDKHRGSGWAASVYNVRAPRAAVPRDCGARVWRSGTQRAESQIRVSRRVRNVCFGLRERPPGNRSGDERTAIAPCNSRPLMYMRARHARHGRKKIEPNLFGTNLITMPPKCGSSCVLPLAFPSCPAKLSSLVKDPLFAAVRRNNNDKHFRR